MRSVFTNLKDANSFDEYKKLSKQRAKRSNHHIPSYSIEPSYDNRWIIIKCSSCFMFNEMLCTYTFEYFIPFFIEDRSSVFIQLKLLMKRLSVAVVLNVLEVHFNYHWRSWKIFVFVNIISYQKNSGFL